MKYLTLSLAVLIATGVFIYTMSFVRWLFRHKQYRGAIGVLLFGVVSLVVPLYILFKPKSH